MSQLDNLTKSLIAQMKLTKEGCANFAEKFDDWFLEIETSWSTKLFRFKIKSRNPNLPGEFKKCSITKAPILSLIARYDNYSFRGKPSNISDWLLQNENAMSLLKIRKFRISLDGTYIKYQGQIKKKQISQLSDAFTDIESLLLDMKNLPS